MNNYRRYKKHAVRSTEDDVYRLMVLFQESVFYRHIDGREVAVKEKFEDFWLKGFNIVSKGESLIRWFENRSELQLMVDNGTTGDYDDPTEPEMNCEDD